MTANQPRGAVDRAPAYPAKPLILAFLIDSIAVILFSAIGRATHGLDPIMGIWETSWTFLLALVVAWGISFAWQDPMAPWRTGLPVWALTVAGAMLLRWMSGQGVDPAFVIVASLILFVLLVGWRLIARVIIVRRRRAGR